MPQQIEMFPKRARARRTDPATSHEAAEFVTPQLSELQAIVMAWAKDQRAPFTDRALCSSLARYHPNRQPSTWRTRRDELTKKGLIEATGEFWRDGSGKRHTLWRVREAC